MFASSRVRFFNIFLCGEFIFFYFESFTDKKVIEGVAAAAFVVSISSSSFATTTHKETMMSMSLLLLLLLLMNDDDRSKYKVPRERRNLNFFLIF